MRRTKIVATLGPATHNPEILSGLISVGADVLRLNFSHGTTRRSRATGPDGAHGRRDAPAARSASWATSQDRSCGSGDIEGDVMHLRNGQALTLTTNSNARRP